MRSPRERNLLNSRLQKHALTNHGISCSEQPYVPHPADPRQPLIQAAHDLRDRQEQERQLVDAIHEYKCVLFEFDDSVEHWAQRVAQPQLADLVQHARSQDRLEFDRLVADSRMMKTRLETVHGCEMGLKHRYLVESASRLHVRGWWRRGAASAPEPRHRVGATAHVIHISRPPNEFNPPAPQAASSS